MKTLTIREPYATLIAKELKKYEFRSWNTKYRGDLYIHAGKAKYTNINDFPYAFRPGEIVAKVTLIDVLPLNEKQGKKIYQENPEVYSLHTDGYAWVLGNVRELNDHTQIKGQLGLWNYEK